MGLDNGTEVKSSPKAIGDSAKSWKKTFGGSDLDQSSLMQQTSDGGYVIVGISSGHYVGLIKTDASGNKIWDKTFGGSGGDSGSSVQETSDGGYVVVGSTQSYGAGNQDVWLIKTDANGNKLWDKTSGGPGDDTGWSVQQTSDGGFAITGMTLSFGAGNQDVWLIKTDANGIRLWDKTFDGPGDDLALSLLQTNDGGYVVAGRTFPYGAGHRDVWLIKTDTSGNKIWDKTFGGSGDDDSYSVQQTSDGGYVITGSTTSFGAGNQDVWLIKTDASGNKLWDKTFGGPGEDLGRSVNLTSDGGYVVTGSTTSFGAGNQDVWLIKTDALGNKLWDKTFGGPGNDIGISVKQTTDRGYVIAGNTNSYGAGDYDVWFIKTDANGNTDVSTIKPVQP